MSKKYFFLFLAVVFSQLFLKETVYGQQMQMPYTSCHEPIPYAIRILLLHDIPGVELGVCGQYSLYDPNRISCKGREKYLSTRFKGKCRYIQPYGCGIKWGEEFPGLYQLKIVDDKQESYTFIDQQSYKGAIYVYDIGNTLSLVNEISIDEYVRLTLNQFEQDFEPEMLCALAIVARTNATYQAMYPRNKYWAVDAKDINYCGCIPGREDIYRAIYLTQQMMMSRTGIYEGVVTPFPAQFEQYNLGQTSKEAVTSKITLQEANEMAKKGFHAAQILSKAFPGVTIMLVP